MVGRAELLRLLLAAVAATLLSGPPATAGPNTTIEIERTPTPIAVDGDLGDWEGTYRIPVRSSDNLSTVLLDKRSSTGASLPATSHVAMQWSDEYVFVAAWIADSTRGERVEPANDGWGDGMAINFDVPFDRDGFTWIAGDLRFSFYPTTEGVLTWWRFSRDTQPIEAGAPLGVHAAAEVSSSGYRLEAAIPMRLLSAAAPVWRPPYAGRSMGFMLEILDAGPGHMQRLLFGGHNRHDGNWSRLTLRPRGTSLPPRQETSAAGSVNVRPTYAVVTVIPAVFTVVHLLLFAFWPAERPNLHYAMFTASLAFLTLFDLHDLGRTVMRTWLVSLLVVTTGVTGVRFIYSLFYDALPRAFYVFVAVGTPLAIAAFWWDWMRTPIYVYCLVSLTEIYRVAIVAILRKKEGARIIGAGCTILFFAGFNQILGDLEVAPLLVNDVYVYGILSLLGASSVYLARSFGQTNQGLQERLRQVQELSAQSLEQERRIRDEEVRRSVAEGELKIAHDLQMGLMPSQSPELAGLDIWGVCQPASDVGGDLFRYLNGDDRAIVALADVTGHAMQAAIPVVQFSGALDSAMETFQGVEELFTRLNRVLHRVLDKRTFVGFSIGVIDPSSGEAVVASCGSPPPLHLHAGGASELAVQGYPLGVSTASKYLAVRLRLQPGDALVLYSDGIPEASNAGHELYSYERTRAHLQQSHSEGLDAQSIVERLIDEVAEFRGNVVPDDDVTCVVVRRS